jgi:hypothetical protein
MAITFLVFGILFLGAGLFFLIKTTRSFVKDPRVNELGKKERKILILSYAAIAAAGGFLQASDRCLLLQWSDEKRLKRSSRSPGRRYSALSERLPYGPRSISIIGNRG